MEVKVDFSLLNDDERTQQMRPFIESGLRDGASVGQRMAAFKEAHPDAADEERVIYLRSLVTGLAAGLVTELSAHAAPDMVKQLWFTVKLMSDKVLSGEDAGLMLVDNDGVHDVDTKATRQ